MSRKKTAAILATALLAATTAFAAEDDAKREAMAFFEKEVRPVLANRCYECHGEKKKMVAESDERVLIDCDGEQPGTLPCTMTIPPVPP